MRRTVQDPARLLPLAFLAVIAAGTLLLLLPTARADPDAATSFVTALFTATSAVCVTGLTVAETSHWSGFGQAMIMAMVHLGGFGIMTAATLLALLVSHRLGVRTRLLATSEGRSVGLANVRGVLLRVALIQLGFELLVATFLTARWWLAYGQPLPEAAFNGAFHGVMAFNNAGFSRFAGSMAPFTGDWWILIPLVVSVVAGSLGFPVLFELGREWRKLRLWSVHTRLTVFGSAALLPAGFLVLLSFEWSNPATLGPLGVADKALTALFDGAVMPRSGGFSTIDFGATYSETVSITNALMFIGGGSASTAGGIKITTFVLLAFVIWSQIRGEPDVVVARRRIADPVQREALSVALLGVALVAGGVLLVDALADGFRFEHITFDVISAFATVGLSTGVTAAAPPGAQLVIAALMFIGRVGPVVLATGLALNTRRRHYRYPEERPFVG